MARLSIKQRGQAIGMLRAGRSQTMVVTGVALYEVYDISTMAEVSTKR